MNINEYNKEQSKKYYQNYIKDIDMSCPKCESKTLKIDKSVILTSNPPQYYIWCDKCDYKGYVIA